MCEHKVCIITTVHPPFDTRIFQKQAKSLKNAGYKVTLIAQGKEEKNIDGIKILPLPKPQNRLIRMLVTSWQAYKLSRVEQASVYHFHDPELIPMALILKLKSKKVIYDVHEDVPEQILNKGWIWKPIRICISRVLNLIEKRAAKYFDAVITATPYIAESFNRKKVKLNVVQNYPLLNEMITPKKNHERINDSNTAAYIGMITVNRGIREMVEAIGLLPNHYHARLLLGGKFVTSALENELKKMDSWKSVKYLGWLDHLEVIKVLNSAKVGLVLFLPVPNHMNAQPNKMFEYMAAGIPVIASNFPLWDDIIVGNKCGIIVNPKDPKAIAEKIKFLFDNPDEAKVMGKRGRRAIETKYNWTIEEKKLLKLYRWIIET